MQTGKIFDGGRHCHKLWIQLGVRSNLHKLLEDYPINLVVDEG